MKALHSIIILLFIAWPASAVLNIQFQFRHYGMENGLSSNHAPTLLQDYKGYIWIGTDNGLNRYDGKQFVQYQIKDSTFHGLSNKNIACLLECSEKNIWVGTK